MFFPEKLKKAVQYVAFKCDPRNLGNVRINKILWKSDVFMHMTRGESITGCRYLKHPNGPVIEKYYDLIYDMESEGTLILDHAYMGNYKIQLIDTEEFNNDGLLSPEEMEILDRFIVYCTSKTAQELSEESHDGFYLLTPDRGEIPMGPVQTDPSEDAFLWAEQVMKEYDQVHT